jgi:hypothetical protein
MGVTIGPADWWARSADGIRSLAISCPVGTALPDGSRIICKAGGTAWIVAPCSTQVSSAWIGGQYPGICVTTTYLGRDFSQVCEWSGLQSCLITSGFNPCDWFVPSVAQLCNPGYTCRSQWDTCSSTCYWSSTEGSAPNACNVRFNIGDMSCNTKTIAGCVRAFRCVTY